jgi:hypothetical protein
MGGPVAVAMMPSPSPRFRIGISMGEKSRMTLINRPILHEMPDQSNESVVVVATRHFDLFTQHTGGLWAVGRRRRRAPLTPAYSQLPLSQPIGANH